MSRLIIILFCLAASPAAAQDGVIGHYSAFIGPEDLYNSRGVRLEDAAAILRQDRANVHRFGIVHAGDERDPWFFQPQARAAMADLLQRGGGIPDYVEDFILQGNVPVAVTIFGANGRVTSMQVDVPG